MTTHSEQFVTDDVENAPVIEHNEGESRFETTVGGQHAVAAYARDGDEIVFTHTLVPQPYEGRGIGNALARAGLDFALSEKLTVVPQCEFIAAYVESHPEYQHLVKGNSPGE